MVEIWEHNNTYSFFRHWVDFCTRRSYRKIETVGTLPEPEGRAMIIAPNHANTLMDALNTLQLRKEGTVFGSRADIFRKPMIAAILHFLRMVPMARRNRDTEEEVARNRETMQEIDRVLAHGMPFAIYSEGTHRTKHSLLPIRRGIAHIAFTSAIQRPTIIVPVGLDYSDWFHYRAQLRIKIGQPIDVNALLPSTEGMSESERDHVLQDRVYEELSKLIFFLPDDETYDERLSAAKAALPRPKRGRDILQAVLSFPLFVVSAVLSLPLWGLAEYLCHFKVKDRAFRNTARFGVRLIGWPLFLIIWAIVFFLTMPWYLSAALLLLYIPSYSIFYDWTNLVRGQQQPLWKTEK